MAARNTSARRPSPYDRVETAPKILGQLATPASTGTTRRSPAAATSRQTYREVLLELVQKRCPSVTPQNDFEIFLLASCEEYKGNDDATFAPFAATYLDRTVTHLLSAKQSPKTREEERADYLAGLTALLDMPPVVTGMKPQPGDEDVRIRPIPNSAYSLRLWGRGMEMSGEYCFDFVDNKTLEPVNSPFEFELVGMWNKDAPWLPPFESKLMSIERAHGTRQEDIPPGEERFGVMEGTICLLKRPGQQDVKFTVPIRPRAEVVPEETAHVIEF